MDSNDDAPKLFRVTHSQYVQYDPAEGLPKALKEYKKTHGDELPPFFLLPGGPIDFHIYNSRITWSGNGPLPEQVMEYVLENGVLPDHKDPNAQFSDEDDDE